GSSRPDRRGLRAVERGVSHEPRTEVGGRAAAAVIARRAVRARRQNGQTTVEQRAHDRRLGSGRRPVGPGRSGLRCRRGRHCVRLRHSPGALMMTTRRLALPVAAVMALTLAVAHRMGAQGGAPAPSRIDWSTDGGDVQRTGWVRGETMITKENVKGMRLQWKRETGNEPRALHALMPALVANNVQTASGRKQLVIVA